MRLSRLNSVCGVEGLFEFIGGLAAARIVTEAYDEKPSTDNVVEAYRQCGGGEALDFLEVNVRQCFEYLGEIIGEAVSDTIIDEVFARFCLGK